MDLDFLFKADKVSTVKYINETLGNYRLLKETKTVADQEKGSAFDRSNKLLVKHRKELSVLHQCKVLIVYGFHKVSKKTRREIYKLRKNCNKILTKTA